LKNIDDIKETVAIHGEFVDVVQLDKLKEFVFDMVLKNLGVISKFSVLHKFHLTEKELKGYKDGIEDARKGIIYEFQLTPLIEKKAKLAGIKVK
jgi:hypothetical protein